MFEAVSAVLERTIDEMEIPASRAALTRCFSLLDRFSAKITAAVAAFDEAELWRDDGATSVTGWLRQHAGQSGREARRWARVARRLATLPVTARAYAEGTLSSGQLQAIVANLSDETAPLFAEAEGELVPRLARLGVKDAGNVMQAWAAAARDHLQPDPGDGDDPEPGGPERSLHLSETLDGRGELSGSLDPEGRALAETALRLAESPDADGEPERTPARRRADALLDICQFFLDNQTGHVGGRHRPHLNVIVDYEDLIGERPGPHDHDASTHAGGGDAAAAQPGVRARRGHGGQMLDGTALDAATIRRLACDAGVHRVVMAGRSSILDYGWTTRTIPANLWAALVARDHHCRFPGCDRPPSWCDGHHVIPWERGGPTRLANLALLCRRHHHLLHTPGWQARLRPDGTIETTDPRGRIRTTSPPGRLRHDLFAEPPPPAGPAQRPAA
jgi:hypothetical protein